MSKFSNIRELFAMFKREEKILIDFFQRRKLAGLKYDYVIDALENNDERLKYLVDKEVLRENSDNYELDELYLSFFEQVLDANEEINTSYINENLETIISIWRLSRTLFWLLATKVFGILSATINITNQLILKALCWFIVSWFRSSKTT